MRSQHDWGPLMLALVVVLCGTLLTCSTGSSLPADTENYGFKQDGWVWVRGPWDAIKPSQDVDDVIDQLCPAIMRLHLARAREYGQEYCGDIYTIGDGQYYASFPSPLGNTKLVGPAKEKSCRPPKYVIDTRGKIFIVADYHGHPWAPSPMSDRDMRASTQLWSIRIQFDTHCRVMKLVPYLGEERPGEVYERLGNTWKLIGIIKPEDKAHGNVTPVAQ